MNQTPNMETKQQDSNAFFDLDIAFTALITFACATAFLQISAALA